MTRKYFYTCPIKALFMMREFGVKFFLIFEEQLSIDLISGEKSRGGEIEVDFEEFLFGMDSELSEILDFKGKIYVKEESEHIFEPKENDVVITPTGCVVFYEKDMVQNNSKIIMRGGKEFLMPEVEQ